MRLFTVPNTCAIAPNIVLREAGLPFRLDRIDLKAGKKTQAGESYLALNPKGYVPALELDDGPILTENAVILQYLADLAPEARLAPKPGTLERLRLQEWLHYIATELHKGMSLLYRPEAPAEFKEWWKANRLAPRWEFLDKSLEGKAFLMGDTFTIADAYAYYVLRAWQVVHKGELSRWKSLAAYYARLSERPSVKAALASDAAPV